MHPTSVSLLDRLKCAGPDDRDWGRLQDLYRPLILRWLDRVPVPGGEAEDLAQEILIVLLREIPDFDRRREGSFRAWLRQITVNKVRTWRRQSRRRPGAGPGPADDFLDRLAAPGGDLAGRWDREHDRHVIGKLLDAVRPDFGPATWEAFRRFALEGLPAAAVASGLGISENAVIQAKSRILKRMREEAGELLK